MLVLLISIFVLVIFRPWLSISSTFSAGDWPYLFTEQIRAFHFAPEIRFLWLSPYYQIITKVVVQYLGIPWTVVERLLWFWPWIFISFFSAKKLTKSALGGLIYTTNTYALMLVGGGQMGVAMAYALAPLVLTHAWTFPVQALFDPRIAILTVVAAVWKNPKRFIAPVLTTIALHTYWWIPLFNNPLVLSNQFQEATSAAVKYLSFASFSQTFSLLHPNWPENIFGKVYFMRSEFLVIPILAFLSLLFLKNLKSDKSIVFFALLALVGAFLAKGAAEPFGGVYVWLFEKVPGFNLFRDSTKFYLFVALGYSMLIPFALERLGQWTRVKGQKLLFIIFLVFWGFTLQEAVMGKLTGTFQPIEVPVEYIKLRDFLLVRDDYFQTGWYPKKSRFTFDSAQHPAVEVDLLDKETVLNENIHYVIVPFDVRGELFITDRVYDDLKYKEAIKTLETIPWLVRQNEFEKLAVFKVNP